jgi:hypothetical protein
VALGYSIIDTYFSVGEGEIISDEKSMIYLRSIMGGTD